MKTQLVEAMIRIWDSSLDAHRKGNMIGNCYGWWDMLDRYGDECNDSIEEFLTALYKEI
jgi:hypothetical protein